jgi:hypothetical protein
MNKIESRLVQRQNQHTNKKEWALVSKKSGKVLKWFGVKKPSEEAVKKEERRVQYFKHTKGDLDYRIEGPNRHDFEGFREGKFPLQMGSYPALASLVFAAQYPVLSKILAEDKD